MTGKSREEQRENLESLIAEFRLQKVRKNLGDQLSGGERRRTEIARCLAIDPKFIMLDEPFAGVDPIAVEDIQYIVWKLKDRNIGILITDHNVEETLSITDRAYLLFRGPYLIPWDAGGIGGKRSRARSLSHPLFRIAPQGLCCVGREAWNKLLTFDKICVPPVRRYVDFVFSPPGRENNAASVDS